MTGQSHPEWSSWKPHDVSMCHRQSGWFVETSVFSSEMQQYSEMALLHAGDFQASLNIADYHGSLRPPLRTNLDCFVVFRSMKFLHFSSTHRLDQRKTYMLERNLYTLKGFRELGTVLPREPGIVPPLGGHVSTTKIGQLLVPISVFGVSVVAQLGTWLGSSYSCPTCLWPSHWQACSFKKSKCMFRKDRGFWRVCSFQKHKNSWCLIGDLHMTKKSIFAYNLWSHVSETIFSGRNLEFEACLILCPVSSRGHKLSTSCAHCCCTS